MFTGIITDIGRIEAAEQTGDLRLRIACGYDMARVDLGASIACSGVVPDRRRQRRDWFAVDVSAETIARTAPGLWEVGTRLNLERALEAGRRTWRPYRHRPCRRRRRWSRPRPRSADRLGSPSSPAPEIDAYIAAKGSVALDGVSLTVNEVESLSEGVRFTVNIIPHTAAQTSFADVAPGRRRQYRDRRARPLYRPDDGASALMERGFLSSPEELIDEARNGRMFILVDDEDRENEGDLVIPAQMATPEAINFMAKHGRGLICLALSKAGSTSSACR